MFHFLQYISAFTVFICPQLILFSRFSPRFLFYHLSRFKNIFYYWFSTLITTTTVHFIFSHTAGEISSLTTVNLHWWQTQWTTTGSSSFISCCHQPIWNKYKCMSAKQVKSSQSRLIITSTLSFTSLSASYFLPAKRKHNSISQASGQSLGFESKHLTAPFLMFILLSSFTCGVGSNFCFKLPFLMNFASK